MPSLPPIPNTPLRDDPNQDAIWKRWLRMLKQSYAGLGTVTSVSVTTANGVSGSVATATTTPAITLTLGAITPSSVTTGAVTSSTLTSGRVALVGTAGLLIDDAGITYNAAANSLTATTFNGALAGNATTATLASTVTVADAASDTSMFVMLAGAATGSLPVLTDAGLSYNAATNSLNISGDISVTGAALINTTLGVTGAQTNASTILSGHTTFISRAASEQIEVDTSAANGGYAAGTWSTSSAQGSLLTLVRSKSATKGTHTAVASGDRLGLILARGSDGSAFVTAGNIEIIAEGTISSGVVPGSVIIRTANSSGTLTAAITIGSNQNLTLSGGAVLGAILRLKGYTVATLPAGVQGDKAYVTDALAPAYLVAVVGGGAVVAEVFYNGAAWICT